MSKFIGKNKKNDTDKATEHNEKEINKIPVNAEVIGEGELDEAPMLYGAEKLGNGGYLDLDMAVDPVENKFCCKKSPRSIVSYICCRKRQSL